MENQHTKKIRRDKFPWKAILFSHPTISNIPPKSPPPIDKWKFYRSLAKKQLSPTAQLKLEWIIFYHSFGHKHASATSSHFGISRKTFHKWLKRFDEKHLETLEEQKREPNNKRHWMVTKEEETNIVALRQTYMEFGKKKLQALYQKTYCTTISCWKIERVIRRHKLYPPQMKSKIHIARGKKIAKKVRIHHMKERIKEKQQQFGFLWHIDTIIIWWYGQRRYIFTAIEEQTRIAYARVYSKNTSSFAEDFLQRLLYLADAKVE